MVLVAVVVFCSAAAQLASAATAPPPAPRRPPPAHRLPPPAAKKQNRAPVAVDDVASINWKSPVAIDVLENGKCQARPHAGHHHPD